MRPIPRSLLCLALAASCRGPDRQPAPSDTTAAAPVAAPTPAPLQAPAPASTDGIGRCPAAAGRDSLCFHAARDHDFAGDGRPFTVTVDARGPAADSMRVALRITRGDTVFHRADWSTVMYGRYDARPVSRDSTRRRVDAQLARLLADSAFRPVSAFLGGAANRDRLLRETIAFDVAVDAERRRRGLTPADTLPTEAAQSPPPTTDTLRVRTLAAALRDAPAFRYFTGGEATYAIAWSAAEHRFVVVFACC